MRGAQPRATRRCRRSRRSFRPSCSGSAAMPGRRAFLLLAGAALGALFLWLAVRKLDWAEFGAALSHANAGDIALGLACLGAYYVLKALRWSYLVEPFAQARTRELMPAV